MAALSAADSYTTPKTVQKKTGYDLIILGTFSGTIQVEHSYDEGATWLPVAAYSEAQDGQVGYSTRTCMVRAGFPPNGYSSGTAEVHVL